MSSKNSKILFRVGNMHSSRISNLHVVSKALFRQKNLPLRTIAHTELTAYIHECLHVLTIQQELSLTAVIYLD